MAALQNLLERLGFVKLNRYGLLLTPDGRILSMRPAVLDDGLGGRIVGWQDSDLAAAELGRWEAVTPVATRVASPPPAIPLAVRTISPVPPPLPVRATGQAPIVQAAIAPVVARPVAPVAVAPKAEEPEDDWEWTIALARARAAAEEVELAAAPLARPAPRRRQDTVPPKTQPMATVAAPRAMPLAAQTIALPRAASRAPKLPAMKQEPAFQPVVRSTSMGAKHALPAAPRRMATGTGPVIKNDDDTRPSIEVGDRTETNIELADQTRPTVMPRASRAR